MDHAQAFEVNRKTWDRKTPIHYESRFYDKYAFAKAKNSLNQYEIQAMGNVTGKSLLHLQCHYGQDSLSWAHKGAAVTGIDFSEKAIALARVLSEELNVPARFICGNVLETSSLIADQFNIVFTSYGTITWLPDLKPWAQMIYERLLPGGLFYIVDFHPIAWMYDYTKSPPQLRYPYHSSQPIYEEYSGTYANEQATMMSKEYSWNHSISSILQSLINAGLTITNFNELDGSPYNVFPNLKQEEDHLFYTKDRLYPLLYEIKASKII